jgi:hypothetical protein
MSEQWLTPGARDNDWQAFWLIWLTSSDRSVRAQVPNPIRVS